MQFIALSLIFLTFWYIYREIYYNIFINMYKDEVVNFREQHDDMKIRAKKVSANISSITSGFIIILTPLTIAIVEYLEFDPLYTIHQIAIINITYNITDIVGTSPLYIVHHLCVIMVDMLFLLEDDYEICFHAMCIFALIEVSNLFTWLYFHEIHHHRFKPNSLQLKIQLAWYAFFRICGFLYNIYFAYTYENYYTLIPPILINVGVIYWVLGMYKKIKTIEN